MSSHARCKYPLGHLIVRRNIVTKYYLLLETPKCIIIIMKYKKRGTLGIRLFIHMCGVTYI